MLDDGEQHLELMLFVPLDHRCGKFERADGVCKDEVLWKGVRCGVGLWQFKCLIVEADGG